MGMERRTIKKGCLVIKMCTKDEKELIESALMVLNKSTSLQIQRLIEEAYRSEAPSLNVISAVLERCENAEKLNDGEVSSENFAMWKWTGEKVEEVIDDDDY